VQELFPSPYRFEDYFYILVQEQAFSGNIDAHFPNIQEKNMDVWNRDITLRKGCILALKELFVLRSRIYSLGLQVFHKLDILQGNTHG